MLGWSKPARLLTTIINNALASDSIVSSKSGRIYLNKDLRIFISKKVDLDTAAEHAELGYQLKAIDEMPSNPRYFSR